MTFPEEAEPHRLADGVKTETGDHRIMRKRVRAYLSDHVAVSLKQS